MIRSLTSVDLEVVLTFQKFYAKAVSIAIDAKFEDNNVIHAFEVLNPIHMHHMQLLLALQVRGFFSGKISPDLLEFDEPIVVPPKFG